jgi:hypothetical protein
MQYDPKQTQSRVSLAMLKTMRVQNSANFRNQRSIIHGSSLSIKKNTQTISPGKLWGMKFAPARVGRFY